MFVVVVGGGGGGWGEWGVGCGVVMEDNEIDQVLMFSFRNLLPYIFV